MNMQPDIAEAIYTKVKGLPLNEQEKVLRIVEAAANRSSSADTRPIWEIATEISSSIPIEEWEKLPSDGSVNHDHYLYGAPKKY